MPAAGATRNALTRIAKPALPPLGKLSRADPARALHNFEAFGCESGRLPGEARGQALCSVGRRRVQTRAVCPSLGSGQDGEGEDETDRRRRADG